MDQRLPALSAGLLLFGIATFAALQASRIAAGDVAEQLQHIRHHTWAFKAENVVGALLTWPSAVLLGWIAAERRLAGERGVAVPLGLGSVIAYVVLTHVAYASQSVLADAWFEDESLDGAWAGLLYVDAPRSVPGLMKLLGYTFCSVASVAIGFPARTPTTVSKWVTSILFASGTFGLLGWLECTARSVNTGLGLAVSGLLVVPYCVAILITERSKWRERSR